MLIFVFVFVFFASSRGIGNDFIESNKRVIVVSSSVNPLAIRKSSANILPCKILEFGKKFGKRKVSHIFIYKIVNWSELKNYQYIELSRWPQLFAWRFLLKVS